MQLPQSVPKKEQQFAEFAPLFFAILSDRLGTAKELRPQDVQPQTVTGDVTWYPLAADLYVPDEIFNGRARLAPVENGPEFRIEWRDIHGHMSGQSTTVGGSDETRIDLHFDDELAAKMEKLSEAHLNRQLAFVFNNRIVAAPHIRSVISNRAHISGRFSQEEIRFLMQALSGGLVDPLPQNVPMSRRPVLKHDPPELELARTKAAITHSTGQLREIGMALMNYESTHRRFPASAATVHGEKQTQPYSWRVAILPHIDHLGLYAMYKFDEPWDSENNRKLLDQMPDVFRSPFAPEEQKPGETNYLGFAGESTALGIEKGVELKEIPDGTSKTLLVVETRATVPWTKPEDFRFQKPEDAQHAIPFEGQPLRVLMGDTSVQEVDPNNWQELAKLITRAGGEPIGPDVVR
jgi:hypothetical protein